MVGRKQAARPGQKARGKKLWRWDYFAYAGGPLLLAFIIQQALQKPEDRWSPASLLRRAGPEASDAGDQVQKAFPSHVMPNWLTGTSSNETVRPGIRIREQGLGPKHPVVVVPGFVTSGLELWQGEACATDFFRKRVWGSTDMTKAFFRSPHCWFRHMRLDDKTGGDPGDIAVRAAEGLMAVDYFFPGYHVWAKLIEALGDLGYNPSNLAGVTYDWRLSVPVMQQRDGYFNRLRSTIADIHDLQGRKAVVVSHSWGDNVFRNFMRWAEQHEPGWCEKHLHAYVNMAGPVLGVPKAVPAMLSGEMRDTAELGMMAALLTNHFIPRPTRARLFRTWGSLFGMLPVGGPSIWGNGTSAPDDTDDMRSKNQTHGAFIRVERGPVPNKHVLGKLKAKVGLGNKTDDVYAGAEHADMLNIDKSMQLLMDAAGDQFRKNVQHWAAIHGEPCSRSEEKTDPAKDFLNPLVDPLPDAPSVSMFCMYGTGSPAERSYHYRNVGNMSDLPQDERGEHNENTDMLWQIDKQVHDPSTYLEHGVANADGDGTVPIISTGVMCYKGWRGAKLNPSGMRIVSREYPHQPSRDFRDLRGGPKSSEHVDILANEEVINDFLLVAAGVGDRLHDNITSAVPQIADRIRCWE